MELYPAVDVQGGRVARAPAADADPLAAVERLVRAGARWIHFVDLDRALGRGANAGLTRAVLHAAAARVRVQVGGGLATEAAIAELLDWGAARIVLGTQGAVDAALLERLLTRYGPERVAVGIDARDGHLAPRAAPLPPSAPTTATELARRVHAQGARTVIYADVARDGMLAGPDVAGARALGTGLDVIVSGGVASLDDLRAIRRAGLAGAIVGRALHEARFTVAEALACVA